MRYGWPYRVLFGAMAAVFLICADVLRRVLVKLFKFLYSWGKFKLATTTMFGFGKKKVPTNVVAAMLAQVVLRPLEDPSEQDVIFQKRAVAAGMKEEDKCCFTFEAIALSVYATNAAINRERLEGRMNPEQTVSLMKEFMRAVYDRLEKTKSYDLLRLELEPEAAMELIIKRGEIYAEPSWGRGTTDDIPRFFAKFCGIPDSDILKRIGWSLFQVRGDSNGEWLKTVKMI